MRLAEKDVTYRVTKPCPFCRGAGSEVCNRCGGRGMVYVPIYGSDQQCPSCGGSGIVKCLKCSGSGTEETYETRRETEWVNDPDEFKSSSYTSSSYTTGSSAYSYSPSSHPYRKRRSGGSRMGRYVVAGIIGGMLGSYVGHVWLGCFLAIIIVACTKKKR